MVIDPAFRIDPSRKICSGCGISQPIDDYHRRGYYTKDGHRAACKSCTAKETKKARESKGDIPISDEARKKGLVRSQTRALILKGELIPRPCEVCEGVDVQAHHPSYDGPEAPHTVQWLCPTHHGQIHGKRSWTKQMDLFPRKHPPAAEGLRNNTYRVTEAKAAPNPLANPQAVPSK